MTADLTPAEHDDIVREEALSLLSQGYSVQARLEGWFDPPDVINGYRPDIVARKDNQVQIVEVEKGEVDWPKISAFELYVKSNPGVKLRTIPAWRDRIRKTGT
jgi:hypothetical protein